MTSGKLVRTSSGLKGSCECRLAFVRYLLVNMQMRTPLDIKLDDPDLHLKASTQKVDVVVMIIKSGAASCGRHGFLGSIFSLSTHQLSYFNL